MLSGPKDFGLIYGTAIASLLTGGIIGYVLRLFHKKSLEPIEGLEDVTKINHYIKNNSLREPEILHEIQEYNEKNFQDSFSLTDPLEAQFIRLLISIMDAKKCLVVRPSTVYYAMNCALAIPKNGTVYALDSGKESVHIDNTFSETAPGHKICFKTGHATENLDSLIQAGHVGSLDFVHIDGNNENCQKYFEKCLSLLRAGGIIVISHTLQGVKFQPVELIPKQIMTPLNFQKTKLVPEQNDTRSHNRAHIDKFNKKLYLDRRVVLSLLRIGDGLTICQKI